MLLGYTAMNKSTPIAQLPSATNPTQGFVNDQQRQYIAQAQQAISNSHMPQNTQASSDIANDDDIVVQDILNQINASSTPEQAVQPDRQPQMGMDPQINPLYIQQMSHQNPQAIPQMMGGGQAMLGGAGGIPPHILYQMANGNMSFPDGMMGGPSQLGNGPMDYRSFLFYFADDLKLASLVFIVTIMIHFIPLDKFIGRYIALDKIPYHDVLLRAIMAAIIVVLFKKLAKI